jgi:hypothetical protein
MISVLPVSRPFSGKIGNFDAKIEEGIGFPAIGSPSDPILDLTSVDLTQQDRRYADCFTHRNRVQWRCWGGVFEQSHRDLRQQQRRDEHLPRQE